MFENITVINTELVTETEGGHCLKVLHAGSGVLEGNLVPSTKSIKDHLKHAAPTDRFTCIKVNTSTLN